MSSSAGKQIGRVTRKKWRSSGTLSDSAAASNSPSSWRRAALAVICAVVRKCATVQITSRVRLPYRPCSGLAGRLKKNT
ncbi:hypothetical protein FQZ97_713140 [compost metagenome]